MLGIRGFQERGGSRQWTWHNQERATRNSSTSKQFRRREKHGAPMSKLTFHPSIYYRETTSLSSFFELRQKSPLHHYREFLLYGNCSYWLRKGDASAKDWRVVDNPISIYKKFGVISNFLFLLVLLDHSDARVHQP